VTFVLPSIGFEKHNLPLYADIAFTAGSDVSIASSWVNFSFGMLTTVGYAGIVLVHPLAHSLVPGEAVTGQLYLAVLVARLVSMQVSAAGKGADEVSTPTGTR